MFAVTRYVASLGAALTLGTTPALALADERAAGAGPVVLADHELDQVTAGEGSLLDLNVFLDVMLRDISVAVNISNVPINAGAVIQANALGTAAQTATVQALQEVTQVQTFAPLP